MKLKVTSKHYTQSRAKQKRETGFQMVVGRQIHDVESHCLHIDIFFTVNRTGFEPETSAL